MSTITRRLVKPETESVESNDAAASASHHEQIRREPSSPPIRMLRLPQVVSSTGLCKTQIYELQAQGDFPMRVKLTARSVAWLESEVQAWLARRIRSKTLTLDKRVVKD
jgi:prophage regulatory protein